jgi:hypothetical protein
MEHGNTDDYWSYWFGFHLYIARSRIARSMVVLLLGFWGLPILFSIMAVLIHIPLQFFFWTIWKYVLTNSVLRFPFLPHLHHQILSFVFSIIVILTEVKLYNHCSYLHFLDDYVHREHIFICLWTICYSFTVQKLFSLM